MFNKRAIITGLIIITMAQAYSITNVAAQEYKLNIVIIDDGVADGETPLLVRVVLLDEKGVATTYKYALVIDALTSIGHFNTSSKMIMPGSSTVDFYLISDEIGEGVVQARCVVFDIRSMYQNVEFEDTSALGVFESIPGFQFETILIGTIIVFIFLSRTRTDLPVH